MIYLCRLSLIVNFLSNFYVRALKVYLFKYNTGYYWNFEYKSPNQNTNGISKYNLYIKLVGGGKTVK